MTVIEPKNTLKYCKDRSSEFYYVHHLRIVDVKQIYTDIDFVSSKLSLTESYRENQETKMLKSIDSITSQSSSRNFLNVIILWRFTLCILLHYSSRLHGEPSVQMSTSDKETTFQTVYINTKLLGTLQKGKSCPTHQMSRNRVSLPGSPTLSLFPHPGSTPRPCKFWPY